MGLMLTLKAAGRRGRRLVVVMVPSAGESGSGAAEAPLLRRRLGFGPRVVVDTFGLEEDGVFCVPPKVSHRIAAVTPASDDLQPTRTASIRARFTY